MEEYTDAEKQWVDWTTPRPTALRDIPAHTLLYTEKSVGCVSNVVLRNDHHAGVLFPEHARINRIDDPHALWNTDAELARSMRTGGITPENVTEHFDVADDCSFAKKYDKLTSALVMHRLPMVCMWTGAIYGHAMCKRTAKVRHADVPNSEVFFGRAGVAFVATMVPVAKGEELTVSFTVAVHTRTMCACMRASVSSRHGTAAVQGCDPVGCSAAHARWMHQTDPVSGSVIYDAANVESTTDFMGKMRATWRTHGGWLRLRPYALSRFASKVSLAHTSLGTSEDMAMISEIAFAVGLYSGTRERPLVPDGWLCFLAANMDSGREGIPRPHTAAMWIEELAAVYPWVMSLNILDFCAYPLIISRELYELLSIVHGAMFPLGCAQGRSGPSVASEDAEVGCARCAQCGAPSTKRCSLCMAEKYCSVNCQRSAWPNHRGGCRPKLSPPLGDASTAEELIHSWGEWSHRIRAEASYVRDECPATPATFSYAAILSAIDGSRYKLTGALKNFVHPTCAEPECDVAERAVLRACTQCATHFYCSDAHAKSHWSTHRRVCGGGVRPRRE